MLKTVLFQTIQFSKSTIYFYLTYIYIADTTSGQSGPGSDGIDLYI